MKKFLLLASLGITVFSLAPYHTMAVPMSPGQTADSTGSVSQPSGTVLPPPPVLVLPPPPSVILLPPPPEPVLISELPPPPSPAAPSTTDVPETGATWFFLLSGLAATFVALTLQQRSSKNSRRDS